MCDWGGGPYGNGAYDPHGVTKHMERDLEVGKTSKVPLDEEQLREIILEEMDKLRRGIVDDITEALRAGQS